MKRTPLYDVHTKLNAQMVAFHDYLLPLQYGSIIDEHLQVRKTAGLFDISHMGRFGVSGNGAFPLIQNLITNDVSHLADKQAIYTPLCNEQGGIIDDILVYKQHDNRFLLVVNSANATKDLEWLQRQALRYQPVKIVDLTEQTSLIALQGPRSRRILEIAINNSMGHLKTFHVDDFVWDGVPITISRTGYTGEDGFEILVDANQAVKLWDVIMKSNERDGLLPAGLGARNTLRLEACLLLYGNDMDESVTPLETTIDWTVKFDKGNFIGREALLRQRERGIARKLVGFEMVDRGIPRQDYPVFLGSEAIGKVTSGSFSPSTNKNIGLCLIKSHAAQTGNEIHIQIRDNKYKAQIVKTPFYTRELAHEHTK
ncbi:MAG: glycine cleavage system aminomethyltransferase GcvT [Planctomycetota bacterium]|mgnify:CR=1 FL=1